MNYLKRNKRKIYLCNQKEENGRIEYTKPREFELNFQPLTSDGEIIAIGSEYTNRLVIYTKPTIAKEFKNKDRCYVYNEIPKEHDKFCNNADFYVDGDPLIFLNEAYFYLQKMTGENDA